MFHERECKSLQDSPEFATKVLVVESIIVLGKIGMLTQVDSDRHRLGSACETITIQDNKTRPCSFACTPKEWVQPLNYAVDRFMTDP